MTLGRRPDGALRRTVLVSGVLLIALGLGSVAWGVTTWRIGDPVTALYQKREQSRLERELRDRSAALEDDRATAAARATRIRGQHNPRVPGGKAPAVRSAPVGAVAARYRASLREGDAVGRLLVQELDLDVVVVFGSSDASLRAGPGLHGAARLPGEGGLVYVSGHRTTYGAPFSDLDRLAPGSEVVLEMPYGVFRYEVTGARVVDDDDLSVLAPTEDEVVRLQACHPRFRGTQRLIVSARLLRQG